MRSASGQGFKTQDPGTCIKVKATISTQILPQPIEQCFPYPIRCRTQSGPVGKTDSTATPIAADNTHLTRPSLLWIQPFRELFYDFWHGNSGICGRCVILPEAALLQQMNGSSLNQDHAQLLELPQRDMRHWRPYTLLLPIPCCVYSGKIKPPCPLPEVRPRPFWRN
jgi:hypothetical protein